MLLPRGTKIKYFLIFLQSFFANSVAEYPIEAQVVVFLLIYETTN